MNKIRNKFLLICGVFWVMLSLPTSVSALGNFGTGDGEFAIPYGCAVDSQGNIYVADSGNNRVQKFDSAGKFLSKFGSWGVANGQFAHPLGIALDMRGNIYIADTGNNRIQKFDSSFNFIMSISTNAPQMYYPRDVVVDKEGNIFAVDSGNNRVLKFNPNGQPIGNFGSRGSSNGQFRDPYGLALDTSGNIYVADTCNQRIQKFDSAFNFVALIGQGEGVTPGKLLYPQDVAVDSDGNIYVSDTDNHRLQKFDSSGNPLEVIGSMGQGKGKFLTPQKLAVLGNKLYVVDSNNNNLQIFDISTYITNVSATPTLFSPNNDSQLDATTISYTLPEQTKVTINIYNSNKELVRNLLNNVPKSAGVNSEVWNGKDNASNVVADGEYEYVISAINLLNYQPPQKRGKIKIDITPPQITNPKATPGSILPAGTVTLTAEITEANKVASVTINLTPLGGLENQLMFDDGTNGDEVAGDGFYTYKATVTADIPSGTKTLRIIAKDIVENKNEINLSLTIKTIMVQLTNSPASDLTPRYSPDGAKIVFHSFRSGSKPSLWVMDADGSNQKQLTTDSASYYNPTFSPDGKILAFLSDRAGGDDIWVMTNVLEVAKDGVNPNFVRLTTGEEDNDNHPGWSPDGKIIAFGSTREGNRDLWAVINADDVIRNNAIPQLKRITTDSSYDNGAIFSPNGKYLAFTSNRSGNWDGWLIANADKVLKENAQPIFRQITTYTGHDDIGDFSPDGKKFVFSSTKDNNDDTNGDIWVVDNIEGVANGEAAELTHLTHMPGYEDPCDWSPDGTKILFYINGNIWVVDYLADNYAFPSANITSPILNEIVSGKVIIKGTAKDNISVDDKTLLSKLISYTLEYGAGEKPGSWNTIITSITPVNNGVLTEWDTAGLSGLYTIRLITTDGEDEGVEEVIVKVINPKITLLSPNSGVVGSIVTLEGKNFLDLELIRIDFGTTKSIAITQTDANGSFTAGFTVDLQPCGIKTITATGLTSGGVSKSSFTILIPQITSILPTSGTIGTNVTIKGEGYLVSEQIRIDFGRTKSIALTFSDANGSFTTTFAINSQPFGIKTITSGGITSGGVANSTFFILPRITSIFPTSGTIGRLMTISGDGYFALEQIQVDFGTTLTICLVTTDVEGRFTSTFTATLQPRFGTMTITVISFRTNQMFHTLFNLYPVSILTWAGISGYESDGVEPDSGKQGDIFEYKVKYIASSPPQLIRLHIRDKLGQVSYYKMSSQELHNENGNVYSARVAINSDDMSSYRFEAIVFNEFVSGTPTLWQNGPLINHLPKLSFVSGDGLEPKFGDSQTIFTCQVKYYDADGDIPTLIVVRYTSPSAVAGTLTLQLTTGTGSNGTYVGTTTLAELGTWTYTFSAADTYGAQAIGIPTNLFTGPIVVAKMTYLTWIDGETNGVNPDTGRITYYTFRVKYFDTENKEPKPGYPKVYVYLGNQLQPGGQPVSMSPINYNKPVDGRDYRGLVILYYPGTYTYRFEAFNVDGRPAVGSPTVRQIGPLVAGINRPPMLSWVQQTNYISDGIHPNVGEPGTMFTYKVLYKDLNNDYPQPGYPKVHIYNASNVEVIVATMTLESGEGDWFSGAVYVYATNTLLSSGIWRYKFEVKDIWNSNAAGAPINQYMNPKISTAPVLSWTGEPGYTDDGVEPQYTSPTKIYTYRVKYRDADNDPPYGNRIYLRIYKDGNLYTPNPIAMNYVSGTSAVAGYIYSVSYSLPTGGYYTHIFEAKDCWEAPAIGLPTYNMVVGPIITQVPTLVWAGISGYESDGVEPDNPEETQLITFKVKYVDTENKPLKEGYPKVYIYLGNKLQPAGSPLTLIAEDFNDNDYTDSKVYYVTTQLPFAGTYTYRFEAVNVDGKVVGGIPTTLQTGPIVTGPNKAPILDWVQQNGYMTDGVEPNGGTPGTMFIYKVRYQDDNNDPPQPGYPKVYIYDKNNVLFMVATMTLESGEGDWFSGAVYVYATNTLVTSGIWRYKFEAKDIWNDPATGAPINQYMNPKVSTAPVLSWTGEPGYIDDGVEPQYTSPTKIYTYRVKYRDADNDYPYGYRVYLRIYKDGNLYTPNPIAMSYISGTSAVAGYIYSVSYSLPTGGYYTHIFEAKDYWEIPAVGTPTYTLIPGPIITQPPTLTWAGGNEYYSDGINPDKGKAGDTFTYLIKYTDLDNDPPLTGYPLLYVYMSGNTQLPGSPFMMDHYDPTDMNFADGKLYKRELPLSLIGTGYSYRFEVKDMNGAVPQLPPGTKTGPIISTPPVLSFVQNTPYNGTNGVDTQYSPGPKLVTYKVIYKDADNDAPSFVKVYVLRNGVVIYGYPMLSSGGNYTTGVVYWYPLTLRLPGTYSYYFEAKDKYEISALGGTPTQEFFAPVIGGTDVARAPQLSWTGEQGYIMDGIEPEQGLPNTTFTYRIKYVDGNNDAPMSEYPRVNIKNISRQIVKVGTMTRISPATVTYAAGVIYEAQIQLPATLSTYIYSFEAWDTTGLSVNTVLKTGPIVSSAPILSEANVSPTSGNAGAQFTFSVKYQDAEGHLPKPYSLKLHVLIGGIEIPGGTYYLALNDNASIVTGRTYRYIGTLSYGNPNYSYYFEAADQAGAYSLAATSTTTIMGPLVTGGVVNYRPELFWLGTGTYSSDGLDPEIGTPQTIFTFKVRYRDLNDNPPQNGILALNIKNGAIKKIAMNLIEGVPGGGIYMATTTLSIGSYKYWIEASDGIYPIKTRLPASGEKTGPKVTNAPILTWTGEFGFEADSINPESGTVNSTSFTYKVRYYDADMDEPEYVQLWIYKDGQRLPGSPFSMGYNSDKKADGCYLVKFNCLKEPGMYSYIFRAKGKDGLMAVGSATVEMVGPIVRFEVIGAPPIEPPITFIQDFNLIDAYNCPNPTYNKVMDIVGILDAQITGIEVKVNIYDIAGDLVWSYEGSLNTVKRKVFGQPDKDAVVVSWNGRNDAGKEVANGVYIFRIIVSKDGKTMSKIGKIAVIR